MRLAIAGGTGLVGRFIVEAALAAGHSVIVLGRSAPAPGYFSAPVAFHPFELDGAEPAGLAGSDALVHAAFSHMPGCYRGGEGDDAPGFARRNGDGSMRLFDAAARAGVGRIVFVSSRAVYGSYPPGTRLGERTVPRPDTLYGTTKWAVERDLAARAGPDLAPVSLRATGVYGPAGPGRQHKWQALFDAFRRGAPIAPRVATEVHGDDLAAAALTVLAAPAANISGGALNVSDLLLDRHDLLALLARLTGWPGPLPPRAEAAAVNAMGTARLEALGWRPGGWPRLRATLPALIGA